MTRRVGVTGDLRGEDGQPLVDIGLAELDGDDELTWEFLAPHGPELGPGDIGEFDAVLVWDTAVGAGTVSAPGRLRHVARLGVGLDAIDVGACTEAGVVVTITPDAVRRPVASGALAFLLALSHRITLLDRVVRDGHWYESVTGSGPALTARTLGIVGLGNIGTEVAALVAPWQMEIVAYDPQPPAPIPAGVTLTTLDELLARADFVVLTCPLTPHTRHMINRKRLARMKPTAHLVNVARGGIVDTDALVDALERGRLAGAALDVLEDEPAGPDHPLFRFENVILAPHSVAVTDDFNLAVGRSAITSIRRLARGERPANVVNPAALDHPRLGAFLSAENRDGEERCRVPGV